MRSVGFPISDKENENRRAIIPEDIGRMRHPQNVFVERGFGAVLGISDEEYAAAGANVVAREEVLQKDIICDPKIGDASYLKSLSAGQILFGWVHATQNRDITDAILAAGLTAFAWEKMYEKGRHVFWFNNELAGEAAVLHAYQCYGQLPYGTRAAVLGNGNTARGASRVLNLLGAKVMQYNRHQEALLREELGSYDVVVNCVLWDVRRGDHIIYREDLKRMKKNSLIIDVSCDRNGGIETSVPTTIEQPTYMVDGVMHYVVDHTPAIFYKTFSYNNSRIIVNYIEELMTGDLGSTLKDSMVIENGVILDPEIKTFQNRE